MVMFAVKRPAFNTRVEPDCRFFLCAGTVGWGILAESGRLGTADTLFRAGFNGIAVDNDPDYAIRRMTLVLAWEISRGGFPAGFEDQARWIPLPGLTPACQEGVFPPSVYGVAMGTGSPPGFTRECAATRRRSGRGPCRAYGLQICSVRSWDTMGASTGRNS